jgi:hypothetical protein
MDAALDIIRTGLSALTEADLAAMSPAQRSVLSAIKKLFQEALDNLENSGDITKKPLYGAALKQLIKIMTALGIS